MVKAMHMSALEMFVRERHWLQSRRILDSAGHPCTKAMADAALPEGIRKEKVRPKTPAQEAGGTCAFGR